MSTTNLQKEPHASEDFPKRASAPSTQLSLGLPKLNQLPIQTHQSASTRRSTRSSGSHFVASAGCYPGNGGSGTDCLSWQESPGYFLNAVLFLRQQGQAGTRGSTRVVSEAVAGARRLSGYRVVLKAKVLRCPPLVRPAANGSALRRVGALGMSWSFDGRQHDVAEFTAVLLRGPLPLLLPPPAQECVLQDCVQVSRHQDGGKSFVPVWLWWSIMASKSALGITVLWRLPAGPLYVVMLALSGID